MSESDQGGAGRREVAYRLFAAEFDDADFSHSESDEERAPNYVITPTGARVNRLFVVGVLTEVESVSEDVLRARVVDPTGAFVLYAGQYQPDEQAFLDGAQTPMFVAVTGKARTFQPDDSEQIYTSVRPESISEVDAATRDRWTVQTAEQTLDRVAEMATARDSDRRGDELETALEEHGVDEGLAAGIPMAIEHYGTTADYLAELRSLALDAARLVAGDIDEVEGVSVAPGDGTDTALDELATAEFDLEAPTGTATPTDSETGAQPETTTPAPSATDEDATAVESETATAESEPTTTGSDATGASDAGIAAAESTTAETDTVNTTTSVEATETDRDSATAATDASGSTQQTEDVEANQSLAADSEDSPATDLGDASQTAVSADAESEPQSTGSTDDAAEDIGDFEPGEFELDAEEREEIEEEFGTEFQSGTEVSEPGEADIETPDPEELAAEADAEAADDAATAAATDPTETDSPTEPTDEIETATATTEQGDEESAPTTEDADTNTESGDEEAVAPDTEDVNLEDAAVDLMGELDEGGGADRTAVVDALVERHGASEADAEAAIQDALMDGRCYEPDDDTLTPI